MPKMKTHKGAKKRLKKTASGKFKRSSAYKNHLATNKTKKQNRQLRRPSILSEADAKRFKKSAGL